MTQPAHADLGEILVPRWKAALLTLVSVALVVVGVILLIEGGAEDRLMAIGTVAFFGACAIVGVVHVLPGVPEYGPPTGRGPMLAMALASVGLAIGCFFAAPAAQADGRGALAVTAYFGTAFFGLGALVIAWQAMRSRE